LQKAIQSNTDQYKATQSNTKQDKARQISPGPVPLRIESQDENSHICRKSPKIAERRLGPHGLGTFARRQLGTLLSGAEGQGSKNSTPLQQVATNGNKSSIVK